MDTTETESPAEDAGELTEAPVEGEETTAGERANLASLLTPEFLKTVGSRVVERRNRDMASRSERMKKLDQLQKLYALIAEQKNFPWQNCANIKTPSLTGPNLQIQARLYDMLWPANGKIFTVVPATTEDQQFSNATETFANAYVRYKMPYMAQGLDDTLHQVCLYGSAFRRTYWDPYEEKVRSDWVSIKDFVVAYSQRSQDPSMSDVPRYTMTDYLSMYEIRAGADRGLYVQTELLKAGKGDPDASSFSDTSDRIDGVTSDDDEDDEDAVRPVLEMHCTWKLPNKPKDHPAFDGKDHRVMITVDAWSEVVLRMTLREEDDPDDRRRFDRQDQAYQKYLLEKATYDAGISQPPPQDMTTPPVMGGPPDMTANVAPDMSAGQAPVAPMGMPPAPLEPPKPAPIPKPVRKRQICLFTHYRCFPSDGFYGLGYGDLLLGLTIAENTVINQWVDGQAIKNAKPMFMSKQGRMARGAINIGPGAINEIDVPMGSIKDAIYWADPPLSDPGTVPLIKMLEGMRDAIAGNGDLMSGQAPGSNQTKGGMQILNEQMMAPITVLARRMKEAFRHELDKIWRCWGVFLDDDDVVDVLGEGNQPQKLNIGRWMFTPSVHLVPASDPRMKSQRVEDLQSLTSFALSLPVIAQNPAVGGPLMTELAKKVFRIYPDGESLIALLTPPPPPPPPPPTPQSQLEENVGFLRDQDHPVHPADNDDEHIAHLQAFLGSPDAGQLDTKGKLFATNHMRAHVAARLEKRGHAFGQTQAFGPQAGGPGPMAGPPGVAPPAGAPPG